MKEPKKWVWPDYENCIANLPNSILKKWNLPTVGNTLSLADPYLQKDYKNVVVFLLDGMGQFVLEKLLDAHGPFRSHLAGVYQSVFLSTTVAATTSAMSGLQPCQHSWLGWDCYYPQVGQNVTVFRNTLQGTTDPAADYPVAWTLTPYKDITATIRKAGGKAYARMPFLEPYPKNLEEICCGIEQLCREPDPKYIYAYWNQPDDLLHRHGCGSDLVKEALEDIERTISCLADRLENTLLFITADHGHVDTRYAVLQDYPNLCDCLVRLPSLEPRALNFFIKEGKRETFEREFKKEFGDQFLLMPMEGALGKNLFGTGNHHPLFRSMLGDLLAIAVQDFSLYFGQERWVSTHGGLTEEEMRIPLLVWEKP